MDGQSLLPILEDPTQGGHEAITLFNGYSGNFLTLVTPNYKYTYWAESKSMPAFEELFDIERDPYEKVNVAQNPEYRPLLEQSREGYMERLAMFNADVVSYNGYSHYPVTLDLNATSEGKSRSCSKLQQREKVERRRFELFRFNQRGMPRYFQKRTTPRKLDS